MKKTINILLVIVMLIPSFCVPSVVHATTVSEFEKQVEQYTADLTDKQNQIAKNDQEVSKIKTKIQGIENQITIAKSNIVQLEKDIEALNNKIATKKQEVKKIISFVQISNGESTYLEYVFGAKSFTDLIYRVAVAEQMSSYNEKLVDEYNNLIDKSKKKQEEISKKQEDLANYQKQLEEKSATLGEELKKQTATSLDIQEEIKAQKEIVDTYKKKGCKDNETISECLTRTANTGKGVLPSGTAFYRPLVKGHVTSEWGTRFYGGKSFHEGIDMGTPEGTTAFAIGTGVVATIIPRSNCGGNMVVVHHNINGTRFTSVYAHLLSIAVSKEQVVTRDTIIGYTGGLSTQSYDSCTGGAHLHLTVSKGLYGIDYTSWSQLNYTYSINPRTVINYPSGGNYWNDRITAY